MNLSELTPREHDIAGLIVDGLTDAEMAQRLGLRIKTVHNYMETLRRKVGAKNRTHLAVMVERARSAA